MLSINFIKRWLNGGSVKITCPECEKSSEQCMEKVHKGITLVCPKCGSLFRIQNKR